MYIPKCPKCGKDGLLHSPCIQLTPQTPEQIAERMEALKQTIQALGELKKRYGIELVCNQKRIDYLESTFNEVEELEPEQR